MATLYPSEESGMKKGMGLLLVLFVSACTESPAELDAGEIDVDAGADAGEEPRRDGGHDAGVDDAGPDAGCECSSTSECCDSCHAISEGVTCSSPEPGTGGTSTCAGGRCLGEPCECSDGPCCDGCFFRPATHVCESEIVYANRCVTESEACPGYFDRLDESIGNRHCPGDADDCTGDIEHTLSRSRPCWSVETPVYCVEDGVAPTPARCGFVCE